MGNGHSGRVVILLDGSAYSPGDSVSGNVFVEVKDATARFGGLCVQVEGYEHIGRKHTPGASPKRSHRRHGSKDGATPGSVRSPRHNIIFHASVPLNLMENRVRSGGQYQYPFTFTLPEFLPPSFSIERSRRIAKIEYRLAVTLQNGQELSGSVFKVTSNPNSLTAVGSPERPLERHAQAGVSDCCGCCMCCTCCWSHCGCTKGTIKVHVGADKDRVAAAGGRLSAYALVWNNSSVPVTCHLQLVRRVRLCSSVSSEATMSFAETVWDYVEDHIYPSRSELHRVACDAFVGAVGVPSVSCQLIKCHYELACAVRPSTGCCPTAVKAVLPVEVLAVDAVQSASCPPIQPTGWVPTVLESQELGIPAAAPPAGGGPSWAGSAGSHSPLIAPEAQDMANRTAD